MVRRRYDLTPLVGWFVIVSSLAWIVILVGGAVLIWRAVFE